MTSRFQANKVLWVEIRRFAHVARHVDLAVARLAGGDGPRHFLLKAGDQLRASMPLLATFLQEVDLSPTHCCDRYWCGVMARPRSLAQIKGTGGKV